MASRGDKKRKKRVPFTPEEDDRLRELVEKYGVADWELIASKVRKRDCRQCKERWTNYLSPEVNLGPWAPEDDALLARKVGEFGRKWKVITGFFPGRTDISVKNHWNFLERCRGFRPDGGAGPLEPDPLDQILTALSSEANGPFLFGPFDEDPNL
jgi:hypothetical protein